MLRKIGFSTSGLEQVRVFGFNHGDGFVSASSDSSRHGWPVAVSIHPQGAAAVLLEVLSKTKEHIQNFVFELASSPNNVAF